MVEYESVLRELHESSQSGFDELKRKCAAVLTVLSPFVVPEFSGYKNCDIDIISQEISPEEDSVALKTTGDGNCCYRAVSLVLCGTESMHTELRVRTIIELALHSFFYLADEELTERIKKQEMFLSGGNFGGGNLDGELVNVVFEQEVLKTCSDNSWASMWQIQALGSVIRMRMNSIYPVVPNNELRNLFHYTIIPRVHDAIKPPVQIMWSRAGNINLMNFHPNHFVPLVKTSLWANVEGKFNS